MTPPVLPYVIADLEDIATVISVVVHGDLNDHERRAVMKGAWDMVESLKVDLMGINSDAFRGDFQSR